MTSYHLSLIHISEVLMDDGRMEQLFSAKTPEEFCALLA